MRIKPKLSFWQIWNMNVGFLGIQFSFGLQQTAINPIFSYLGADHDQLPLLNLAGPITGLIVQPIIGAISDKTWIPKWGGRRKPFFLIGAILASLCLFAFPYSPGLWFAVGLLWILDVGNNTAMEPYRAFVGDKLPDEQLNTGFQMQSLFVGAGIVLANFSIFLFQDWFSAGPSAEVANTIPRWLYYSFFLGAVLSIGTILWSVLKTPEIPPSEEELKEIEEHKKLPFSDRFFSPFKEIFGAIKDMPKFLWRLAAVYLFQWYALFIYWQYIALSVESSLGITKDEAVAQAAKLNGTYNFVTMVVALALVPIARKIGSKRVYVSSLFLTGIAMLSLPYITNSTLLLLPMILFGIGWACMMGIPYSMVSKVVPAERRGVYMGIVNMMIVIPMAIQNVTFGPIIKYLLDNDAVKAILFAGVFFIIAAVLATRLTRSTPKQIEV
ncbi:MAG: MFS transporter [Flavobacteriaceae bacterium]|nr:MFS transporter [Flavobacteriaceae bacterium]